jgi:hypothetical protein
MGCDIHTIIEKNVAGKWITVAIPHYSQECNSRYYHRFNLLCSGVRGDGSENKKLGIPPDASETAKYLIEEYGVDGHSHSYMDLNKAARICLQSDRESPVSTKPNDFAEKYPTSHYFGIDEVKDGEYRLVFWFDN